MHENQLISYKNISLKMLPAAFLFKTWKIWWLNAMMESRPSFFWAWCKKFSRIFCYSKYIQVDSYVCIYSGMFNRLFKTIHVLLTSITNKKKCKYCFKIWIINSYKKLLGLRNISSIIGWIEIDRSRFFSFYLRTLQ